MPILHTTEFDEKLKAGLKHLQNYPQMTPFIGLNWNESKTKALLLGESHYISGDKLADIPDETHLIDWYNNNSDNFYQELADSIDTRGVVEKADNVEEEGFAKPLTMFYSIKREIQLHIPELQNEKHIFQFFSFYNYFQRPHFEEGGSIENNKTDDELAYSTLKFITQLVQPHKIIFVSAKAKYGFDRELFCDNDKLVFSNIMIDAVPHAGCQWWNREAAAYGNKTGREKFISLITNP